MWARPWSREAELSGPSWPSAQGFAADPAGI